MMKALAYSLINVLFSMYIRRLFFVVKKGNKFEYWNNINYFCTTEKSDFMVSSYKPWFFCLRINKIEVI